MVFRSAKSPLERRLHEVAKDSAELRSEIKRLRWALKKPERLLQHKDLLPAMPRGLVAKPPAVRPATPEPEVPTAPAPVAPTAPAGELFPWNPAPGVSAPMAASRKPAPDDERFAHYFSSTGFLGKPALRQERSVLRRRAIFMVILVIILGVIVFGLIFR